MSVDLIEQLDILRRSEEAAVTTEPRKLWQSIDELGADFNSLKAVRGQELAVQQEEAGPTTMDLSRRKFLQFSAAASALVATTACTRRPVDHLVPYVKKPEGLTYGVPMWYATTASNGFGVLVKTMAGKPIKLEGNPDHPVNQGGLDAATQASLFDLYNPERLKTPIEVKSGKSIQWAEVDAAVKAATSEAQVESVRVLTGPVVSPSTTTSMNSFLSSSKGTWHKTQDLPDDPIAEAINLVSGQKSIPTFRFEKADVVVSVDADFLGTWIRPLEFTKSFSKRRKLHRGDANVNRLYVFESLHSLTGIAADHRMSIKPSQQLGIILAIGSEVSKSRSADAGASSFFTKYSAEKLSAELGFSLDLVKRAAADLSAARGKSLVVAGGHGPHALELQIASLALNSILGNIGSTLDFESPMKTGMEQGNDFESLLSDMEAGKVSVLFIQGVNPVYSSANTRFKDALSKVKLVLSLSHELNETASLSTYALPESHYLEAWGDSEIREGHVSIQQPVIEPLYNTRSLAEVVEAWDGRTGNYRDIVSSRWQKIYSRGDFRSWWMDQLKTGAHSTGSSRKTPAFRWAAVTPAFEKLNLQKSSGLELVLYSSVGLGDGSRANNPYLQELPDPVTKVTWDNFAGISPVLAAKMGLNRSHYSDETPNILASDFASDVVEVSVNGKSVKLPVFVQPGLDENVVAIALGYGRKVAGSLGTDRGQDANLFAVRNSSNKLQLRGQSATIKKTSDRYELACTQKQFGLQGRDSDILHTYTLKEFEKTQGDHGHGKYHIHPTFSIYDSKEFVYPGHKWGMAVDLNSCTGCNACVVACYTENNVSTVGPDQIAKGRHQAWLRLDLYHSGDAANPDSTFEPMMCQHCDLAPCETVCPVLATVHSTDGLNDMSYNRCVGTRYCANNCPYKVRRFNWFQYSDKLGYQVEKTDPLPMLINPDVSVRTRGVMEKCTFCVQRIRSETSDRMTRVKDGSIKTACQQSCPADAIVFGDLNDPESEVSQLAKVTTGFKVLEILNTKPNVTYLPRVRNKESSV